MMQVLDADVQWVVAGEAMLGVGCNVLQYGDYPEVQ